MVDRNRVSRQQIDRPLPARERELRDAQADYERTSLELEERYLATSQNPSNLPNFFDTYPDAREEVSDTGYRYLNEEAYTKPDGSKDLAKLEEYRDYRKAESVALVEEAYTTHRGMIPAEWWLKQASQDIAMLNDPLLQPLVEQLVDIEEVERDITAYETALEEKVALKIEQAERGSGFSFGNFIGGLPGLRVGGTSGGRPKGLSAKRKREIRAEVIEDERAAAEGRELEERRSAIAAGGEALMGGVGATFSTVGAGISGMLRGIDTSISKVREGKLPFSLVSSVPRGGGNLAQVDASALEEPVTPIFTYWFEENQKGMAHREIQKIQESTGRDLDEFIRKEMVGSTFFAFEALEEENPEAFTEVMRLAGGDRTKAMGIFGDGVNKDPETVKALAQYKDDLEEAEREMIRNLEDFDFSPGKGLLNILSIYGRNGPMRLATGFTLLLTDDDIFDEGFTQAWHTLGERIEESGFSPAAALDMDGSLGGLLLDLTGGIIFDPVTWLFGPRGSIKTNSANAVWDAGNMVKSTFFTQAIKDVYRHATSGSRTVGGMRKLASIIGDDIAVGQILHLTGFQNQILKFRLWSRGKMGKFAEEMQIKTVEKIMDGDSARFIGPADPALKANILENGLDDALEITVSRADGGFHLSDGGKRMAALREIATETGLKRVPVRLKIVDEAHTGNSVIQGLDDAESLRVSEISNSSVKQLHSDKTRTGSADVRANVFALTTAKRMSVRPENLNTLGSITNAKTGAIYKVQVVDGGAGQTIYHAVDDAGELVASAIVDESFGGGLSIANAEGLGPGTGVMSQLMDLAAIAEKSLGKVHPITLLGKTGSTTKDAAQFGKGYATRLIAEKGAPQMRRVGTKIDDILEEGETLVTPLEDYFKGNGDTFIRPGRLLPDEHVAGKIELAGIQQIMEDAVLKRGFKPGGAAQRGAMGYHWNAGYKQALRSTGPGRALEKWFTPETTTTSFGLTGPGAIDDAHNAVVRLLGDDLDAAEPFTQRLVNMEIETGAAEIRAMKASHALRGLQREVDDLRQFTGNNLWDSTADGLLAKIENSKATITGRAEAQADLVASVEARAAANVALVQRTKDLRKALTELDEAKLALGSVPETIQSVLEDLWTHVNKTQIATQKGWKAFVNKDGIVPWDDLQRPVGREGASGTLASQAEGPRQFLTKSVKDMADELGILDPEALFAKISGLAETPVVYQVPLSMADLMAASTTSGSTYTRIFQNRMAVAGRELAFATHKFWVMDKVFKASTAGVVSFDELLRLWDIGGTQAGFMRWGRDRGTFIAARAKAVAHGRMPTVKAGAEFLSPRQQERLRKLGNADRWTAQAERQFLEGAGLGWDDIVPGDAGYLDAARRYTGGMLQDPGFRAALRGQDDFIKFYESTQGDHLRKATALVPDGHGGMMSTAVTAEELFQGWETMMGLLFKQAEKAGMKAEVLASFQKVGKLIDEGGGAGFQNVDDFVFQHLGPVRGIRKDLGNTFGARNLSDKFFDNLFMKPVNYRRGFLAELTREAERARLNSLYASQGRNIVSDLQFESQLQLQGYGGLARTPGARQWLQKEALDSGVILESYVDDLVERAVRDELTNVLYTFDQGSRAGRHAINKAVFPFGKPWADMVGFWGRETLRKPALRGWINNTNSTHMASIFQKLPFNPKPPAMISRLAATDFTIDKGLLGGAGEKLGLSGGFTDGGVLPGSDRTDFSPLFFLPTGGENPFGTILPGLGFIPAIGIDQLISSLYDPIEEPEKWNRLVDQISQFIPSVAFQQGGIPSRLLGGGTLGEVVGTGLDVMGAVSGTSNYGITSMLGDIDREIDRTREMSARLADPEEWEELMGAQTVEEFEVFLLALANEADITAGTKSALSSTLRWAVPASTRNDEALDQIMNIWTDAADKFPDFLQPRPSLQGLDLTNPENLRAVSDDIRRTFFDLPGADRDRLIVQFPQLAVNLVSSWEWTATAQADGVDGIDQAYRSSGTARGRALHQNLVDLNYIRPLQPIERAKRIIGSVHAAQLNVAKSIYTDQAQRVNDHLWKTAVSSDTMELLNQVLRSSFADKWGIETAQELWQKWGTLERELEMAAADAQGIEQVRGISGKKKDLTAFDKLRKGINIPTDEQSWGTAWPGLDDKDLSRRFSGLKINRFSDEVQASANAIGIELVPGVSGLALFEQVQAYISTSDNPAFQASAAVYRGYLQERNLESTVAMESFRRYAHNPYNTEEWTGRVEQFLFWEGTNRDRYFKEVGGIPLDVQQETVNRFQALRMTDSGNGVDWDSLWEKSFERSYGPLDWDPPEPRTPLDEDGNRRSSAFQPTIMTLRDGDSLVIKMRPDQKELTEVRLLGVRAADFGRDSTAAQIEMERLMDAIQEGVVNGDKIWLVRDPNQYGNHDQYGRMLAWLWIGDEPYFFPDAFRRHQDPSGGE